MKWSRDRERPRLAVLKRINALLKDVERNGNEGSGEPEPLERGVHGVWSRRTTDAHRLEQDRVRITACRYRYGS